MEKILRIALTKIRHNLKGETSYMPFENAFKDALGFIKRNRLKGDFLEFGVAGGATMIEAIHYAYLHRIQLGFHGFDSFEGLPEPSGIDNSGVWKRGDYKNPYEVVSTKVWKHEKNVKFYRGWYNKTLVKKIPLQPLIVHVDCDLYESTVEVLKFLSKYEIKGMVIMFNDWFHFNGNPKLGEQKAFYEWIKAENISAVPFGTYRGKIQSFILNR